MKHFRVKFTRTEIYSFETIVEANNEDEAIFKVENSKFEYPDELDVVDETRKAYVEDTDVVFVMDGDTKEPLAIFPNDKFPNGMIGCYAHNGQYSKCERKWAKKQPLSQNYSDLKRELESVGYKYLNILDKSAL